MASQLKRTDLGDGWWLFHDADLGATAHNDIVGGDCTLHHVAIKNAVDAFEFVKFYDDAAPTVGTTDPIEIIMSEKLTADQLNDGCTSVPINPPNGIDFDTALSFARVTTAGTAGTTGAASDNVEVSLLVKEK